MFDRLQGPELVEGLAAGPVRPQGATLRAQEPAGPAPLSVQPDAQARPQFTETSQAAHLSWTAAEESYDEFLDQRLLPAGFNRRGPAIAVGDLDGSGRDGVCIGGTTREARRVLLPQGADTWELFVIARVITAIRPPPAPGPVRFRSRMPRTV